MIDCEKALQVINRVGSRIFAAHQALEERTRGVEKRIEQINNEELPAAILESLVIGDRTRVNALYQERQIAELDMTNIDQVQVLLTRFSRQVVKRRSRIEKGKMEMLPKGDPLTWWPDYLTTPDEHSHGLYARARNAQFYDGFNPYPDCTRAR